MALAVLQTVADPEALPVTLPVTRVLAVADGEPEMKELNEEVAIGVAVLEAEAPTVSETPGEDVPFEKSDDEATTEGDMLGEGVPEGHTDKLEDTDTLFVIGAENVYVGELVSVAIGLALVQPVVVCVPVCIEEAEEHEVMVEVSDTALVGLIVPRGAEAELDPLAEMPLLALPQCEGVAVAHCDADTQAVGVTSDEALPPGSVAVGALVVLTEGQPVKLLETDAEGGIDTEFAALDVSDALTLVLPVRPIVPVCDGVAAAVPQALPLAVCKTALSVGEAVTAKLLDSVPVAAGDTLLGGAGVAEVEDVAVGEIKPVGEEDADTPVEAVRGAVGVTEPVAVPLKARLTDEIPEKVATWRAEDECEDDSETNDEGVPERSGERDAEADDEGVRDPAAVPEITPEKEAVLLPELVEKPELVAVGKKVTSALAEMVGVATTLPVGATTVGVEVVVREDVGVADDEEDCDAPLLALPVKEPNAVALVVGVDEGKAEKVAEEVAKLVGEGNRENEDEGEE